MGSAELVDVWWNQHCKDLMPKTRRGYKTKLDCHILKQFGESKLTAITPEACQAFKEELRETECVSKEGELLSNTSINAVFTIMHGIFTFAIEQGFITRNPVQGITKLPISKREVKVIYFQDIKRLVACLEGDYRAFLATICYTGMRPSEAMALIWSDVDFDKRFIYIRRSYDRKEGYQNTKSPSGVRKIPMLKPLYDLLQEHYEKCQGEPDQPVFMARNGKPQLWYHGSLQRAFDRAGLPRLSVLDLRHSFLSALDSMGVRLTLIKEIAGHSTIVVTSGIYTHQTERDLSELREQLDDSLP